MAYYRDPKVNQHRKEAGGQESYVRAADNMVSSGFSSRRDEWEQISFWTIHTFVVATNLARGFLSTDDAERRLSYAREFRDWVVAYAGYEHYSIMPPGGRLGGPPYLWGDQWHMERSTRLPQCYFSFLSPDVDEVIAGPVEEHGGERFDFWCLKFALDQIVKADGLAAGYRGGNHGWFQINGAVNLALMLPEFKVADRMLQNALKRAVERVDRK